MISSIFSATVALNIPHPEDYGKSENARIYWVLKAFSVTIDLLV